MNNTKAPFNLNDFPPAILLLVFHLVGYPAPSETRLHEQPSESLLSVEPEFCSLKSASVVCKVWRSLALPKLFRHVLWRPQVSSLSAFTLSPIPLLRFLVDNKLDRAVQSFTLIIDFVDEWADAHRRMPHIRSVDLEWFWDLLFSVIDPLRFTIVAPPTTLAAFMSRMLFLDDAWSFDMPYHILSLSRAHRIVPSASTSCLETTFGDLKLSAVQSDAEGSQPDTGLSSRPRLIGARRSRPQPPPCPLFTIRPWTSLLLNEGSSTNVYRTYEFFLRRPPSMLGALLGCEEYPNDTPLVPSSVVDLSYVAIFPLSAHFDTLMQNLPRIDRLFIQLTPGKGSSLLDNKEDMHHIDLADLWMERNTSYSYLMRELTTQSPGISSILSNDPADNSESGNSTNRNNWAALRVFESGDAADKEAWGMYVEHLRNSGFHSWKIEREGVLIKQEEVPPAINEPHMTTTSSHPTATGEDVLSV